MSSIIDVLTKPRIALRIERYNILSSFDQPVYVGVQSSGTVNIEITGTNDPTTPLFTGTVNKGYNPIMVISQNPFVLPRGVNAKGELLYVKNTDTNEVQLFPILNVRSDVNDPFINFKDENGQLLHGYATFACMHPPLMSSSYGTTIGLRATSAKLADVPIDPKMCFLEFSGEKDGKKYYIIIGLPELEQKIGNARSIDLQLSPLPEGKAMIVIEYDLNVVAQLIENNIEFLSDYSRQIVGFITNYFGGAIEFVLNNTFSAARIVSKILGLDYTIYKVEIENNVMRVYYIQDPSPMTIAAAIALASLSVGLAWFIASGGIIRVYSIIASTITYVVSAFTISKMYSETAKLVSDAAKYCRGISATPEAYEECVQSITGTLRKATQDLTLDNAIEVMKELKVTENKLSDTQSKTLLYGIGGLALGAILTRR